MIFGVYAIRDAKTGFLSPTIDSSDAVAVRNFNSAIMRSDGLMLTHCDDFSLYHIGSYDTDSAAITPLSPTVYLASGADAMKGG